MSAATTALAQLDTKERDEDACLIAYQAYLRDNEQAGTYHVFHAGWLAGTKRQPGAAS